MLSHDLARALLARRDNDVRVQVLVDDDPTGETYRVSLVQLRDQDRTIDPDLNAEPVVGYDADADAVVIRAGCVVLADPHAGEPCADRGRDVSHELSEVRTVLSRAENAIATLTKYRNREFHRTRHVAGRGFVDDRTPDPDVRDMIDALERVVAGLTRWRRAGR